jgi:hypothetical protein
MRKANLKYQRARIRKRQSPVLKGPPRRLPPVPMHLENAALPECTVVPEQFFPTSSHAAAHRSGVRRLLLAVLQDAVACWFRYRHARNARGQRLFRETHAWFWATDEHWLFAFEHICEQLKLDPDYIRRGLSRWQTSQADPPPPIIRTEAVPSSRYLSLVRS